MAINPSRIPGDFEVIDSGPTSDRGHSLIQADPGAAPFKLVVDPKLRQALRRALIDLIEFHDEALAEHVAEGRLALDSYKEYIELFARSLRETMQTRDGVAYLLRSAGFDVAREEINLQPELRWKKGAAAFGATLI